MSQTFFPGTDRTDFWTNQPINLSKLDEEINLKCNFLRWNLSPNKAGFSGLSMNEYKNWQLQGLPAKYQIFLHWTLDGKNGFDISLPPGLKNLVQGAINEHTP